MILGFNTFRALKPLTPKTLKWRAANPTWSDTKSPNRSSASTHMRRMTQSSSHVALDCAAADAWAPATAASRRFPEPSAAPQPVDSPWLGTERGWSAGGGGPLTECWGLDPNISSPRAAPTQLFSIGPHSS